MAAEILLNPPYVDHFVLCQSLPIFYWSKMMDTGQIKNARNGFCDIDN